MNFFKAFILVGSGSFLGGGLRYAMTRLLSKVQISTFPVNTFVINILGSFLIGLIYGWLLRLFPGNESIKLFLAVGFCGGFTTFSTFANENFVLLRDGWTLISFLYCAFSIIIGISAVYAGYSIISEIGK